MPWQIWMFGLRNAVDQEQKTETEHASGFHSRETLYLNAFVLIYFLTFNTYKYAFPLFPFYSFDNDDMKSSKRHVILLSLIFLLKCFSKSFLINNIINCRNATRTRAHLDQFVD